MANATNAGMSSEAMPTSVKEEGIPSETKYSFIR